ncbi:MAG: hypothetical protein ACJA1H_002703 [Glaciecola sp.]|jgi:hypothetical protein
MKYLKIISLVVVAYIITALLYGEFWSFTSNFGSIWINLWFPYILGLGLLLGFISIYSKNIIKIGLLLFSLLFLLLLIDSPQNLKFHSIIVYFLLIHLFLMIVLKTEFVSTKIDSLKTKKQ